MFLSSLWSSLIKNFKRIVPCKFKIKIIVCSLLLCLALILGYIFIDSAMIIKQDNIDRLNYSQIKTVNWSEYHINPRNRKNQIIILSYHRSGSSFLGNLLQKSWPTFYIYEPLHYLGKYTYVREIQNQILINNSLIVLNNLFKCEKLFENINKSLVIWVPKLNDVMGSIEKGKKLSKNVSNAKFICDRCKNIVLKTVRVDIEYLVKFYNHFNSSLNPVKSVVLFRDPRAIMNSRLSLPADTNFCNGNCRDARTLCGHIRSNIEAIFKLKKSSSEIMNHLTFLRFEDLSLKPKVMAKKLYEKLGLNYTKKVKEWVEKNTQTDSGGPFKTSRKSVERIVSWVKNQDKTNINLNYIQTHCADVMHVLGYKIISSEDRHKINSKSQIKTDILLANEFPFKQFLL